MGFDSRSISRDCGAIRQCVLGDIFSRGLPLSSEGVGCSGGGVWLEQGKREKRKKRKMVSAKQAAAEAQLHDQTNSEYLPLPSEDHFFQYFSFPPNSPPKKEEMEKKKEKETRKNRLTSQTPFQSSPNANSSSSSASCPCHS